MISESDRRRIKSHLMVWWIVWAGILGMVCAVYFIFTKNKPLPPAASAELLLNIAGFVPLFVSVIIRWLVLPRYSDPVRAFVVFIIGLSLADACSMFGIFIGGGYRDALFMLGVLGIIQYAPFYARRFFEPKVTGFIPNN